MPGWAGFLVALVAFFGLGGLVEARRTRRRRQFIDGYVFPKPLERRLRQLYPDLSEHDAHRVLAGLKEWFHASLEANGSTISMPSRVVDDAWHEFILMTKAYAAFCDGAFGRFLHHTPNAVAAKPPKGGIPRTLDKLKSAGLVEGSRLPALFTLDQDLGIENGRRWTLEEIRELKKVEDDAEGCLGASDQDRDDGCGGCA